MKQLDTRPSMGQRFFRFRGDRFDVGLSVSGAGSGRAFLRTNISNAGIRRREIVAAVEQGIHPLEEDWLDIEMQVVEDGIFGLSIPLLEVGAFEAKPFFLPDGQSEPLWPPGDNWSIAVAPCMYRSWNGIYCAFVRQFGTTKTAAGSAGLWDESQLNELDRRGFSVIPPSGTFRDLIAELDHIFFDLNCRILHLLPIHPTPSVFGKMGRFGSPYASQDFTGVDPHLAEFDRAATPLDQFLELIDAVHARGGRLILDMALNHTGWGAKIHETHPQWLKREGDGSIKRPGAWGVTWADLTELDHTQEALWPFLYDVLATWCERGVDGFRCDAGYMIPEKAWTYIVAKLRQTFPDTLFLLEGLGGKLEVTQQLLSQSNLNFAYSELFQIHSAEHIHGYMAFADSISRQSGLLVHYAETHDNNRLAATSEAYARMRVGLCALLSPSGGFGFANGVEWFAREKIDVHGSSGLNWGHAPNQIDHIARLNALLRDHPCFWDGADLRMIPTGQSPTVAALRTSRDGTRHVLVVVNLDCEHHQSAVFDGAMLPSQFSAAQWVDLLTDVPRSPKRESQHAWIAEMAPAEAVCLSPVGWDGIDAVDHLTVENRAVLALDLCARTTGLAELGRLDRHALSLEIADNPHRFCADRGDVQGWRFPHDLDRLVILGPNAVLLVRSPHAFRARFAGQQKDSVSAADGTHFSAFYLPASPDMMTVEKLDLRLFKENGCRRARADVLCVPADSTVVDPRVLSDMPAEPRFLDTNGRGAMLRTSLIWGRLESRYDALLAGNLHARVPVDRWVSWRRCRMWARLHGYSVAMDATCTQRVMADESLTTVFRVPLGSGRWITLRVTLAMIPGENATLMTLIREPGETTAMLADAESVRIIVRPDVEDRSFHAATKAYLGPENHWPNACTCPDQRTVVFAPHADRRLILQADSGAFQMETEWHYNVTQREETERGFDADTDVFSPGYFSFSLVGGGEARLLGQLRCGQEKPLSLDGAAASMRSQNKTTQICDQDRSRRTLRERPFPVVIPDDSLGARLKHAMRHFIVARDDGKTVIAGYPWFLDWGRDTLIAARGLLTAGYVDETADILRQFARFEDDGTLPNMIRGEDARNRDTSDAPLWFFVACQDLCRLQGHLGFLAEDVGGRSIGEVLVDLAEGLIAGAANGVYVDAESALMFSPPHFTWMDTNHPAGTPRCGYPIEIQALWFRALKFLAEVDQTGPWKDLHTKVRQQVVDLFWLESEGFFADCLHARPGEKPQATGADDALRPNQLLGVTLGLLTGSKAKRALARCEELVVPGGIRSLADRPVKVPLPVKTADGHLLNDPQNPFWGSYSGDEDTRRKPAYHNGTAWGWLFPSFSEALLVLHGAQAKSRARAILATVAMHLDSGCVGQLPEIFDGHAPHTPRGCDAQAWSVTEAYRVWQRIQSS